MGMKTMNMKLRLIISFLMLLTASQGMAQQSGGIDPGDSAFNARYAQVPFGDRFAMQVLKSDGKNYFLVDLSKLPSRFERVFFMTIAFKQDKLVNIDPEITRDRIWFFAYETYPVREIEELLTSLKDRAVEAGKQYTDLRKQEWLLKNDKYK
jgi:hypothetical protein